MNISHPTIIFLAIHFIVQNGWTVLKQASFSGHCKVVELLLEAGANPDLQDKVRTGQESGVQTLKMLSEIHGTSRIL